MGAARVRAGDARTTSIARPQITLIFIIARMRFLLELSSTSELRRCGSRFCARAQRADHEPDQLLERVKMDGLTRGHDFDTPVQPASHAADRIELNDESPLTLLSKRRHERVVRSQSVRPLCLRHGHARTQGLGAAPPLRSRRW